MRCVGELELGNGVTEERRARSGQMLGGGGLGSTSGFLAMTALCLGLPCLCQVRLCVRHWASGPR